MFIQLLRGQKSVSPNNKIVSLCLIVDDESGHYVKDAALLCRYVLVCV